MSTETFNCPCCGCRCNNVATWIVGTATIDFTSTCYNLSGAATISGNSGSLSDANGGVGFVIWCNTSDGKWKVYMTAQCGVCPPCGIGGNVWEGSYFYFDCNKLQVKNGTLYGTVTGTPLPSGTPSCCSDGTMVIHFGGSSFRAVDRPMASLPIRKSDCCGKAKDK